MLLSRRFPPYPFISIYLALVAALFPRPALANLRAPKQVLASPSGALHGAAAGLSVAREELRFECATACAVSAIYSVRATAAGRFAFDFLLPVDQPITVKVGDAEAITTATEVELPKDDGAGWRREHEPRSFHARFEGALLPGLNTIQIGYRQPLGALEHDYGYFKPHGRFVSHFEYLLGPLKEWTLEADFAIHVQVAMERPRPGYWARHFGTLREIACMDARAQALDGAAVQKGSSYVLDLTFRGRAFPDVLRCEMGDADLLPKHEDTKAKK